MKTIVFSSILFFVVQAKTFLPSGECKYSTLDINGSEYTIYSTNTKYHKGDTIYYAPPVITSNGK